jgi:hypothetical protein
MAPGAPSFFSTHPSPNQLEHFLQGGELSEELQADIGRHLLARCPQCLEVTRRVWAGASGKVPKPNPPPAEARQPKRRPRAPLSAAARAALESAAQERLLEIAGVLLKASRELKTIAAALPPPADPPSGEDSATVELRALIDCVLVDLLGPAIQSLHAAAAPYV